MNLTLDHLTLAAGAVKRWGRGWMCWVGAMGIAAGWARGADGAVRESLLQKDFPVQAACIGVEFPPQNVALKGLAIRLGGDLTLLFDTDLCRWAAGWSGGYITTRGVAFDGAHGHHPTHVGRQLIGVGIVPGVAALGERFEDTRPEPFGPVSAAQVRWNGLRVQGMGVELEYGVLGENRVREQPSAFETNGVVTFRRTMEIVPQGKRRWWQWGTRVNRGFSLLLGEVDGAQVKADEREVIWTKGDRTTRVTLNGLSGKHRLAVREGRVVLDVLKGARASVVEALISVGDAGAVTAFASQAIGVRAPEIRDFSKGGTNRWPEAVMTQGALNTSATPDGAYVTDSLTAPEKNPWNRRVRFGGFDFFPDGRRAAFCTHDGDVWIVSGIDEKLDKLEWRRFASGLYEPLGLVIVDGVIYTSGRDQLTRLRDVNGDGEADLYENFNNEIQSTRGFHEFVFDLQRDKAGNFYFVKANPVNAGGSGFGNEKASLGNGRVCSHAGCLFKVSPDGKKFEILARGYRAPNGIGVSPDGQVTTSDNEGTWVPTTPINWVKPGGFSGVINSLTPTNLIEQFTPPLAWLSKRDYDNSGGGQIWVTSDRWGPFQGELLHESYGKSSLFLVMHEAISGDRRQGGVVRFPLKFTSSVMRARFHPVDGQLYVAGLSEWQSNAARITGFDRVRYTGKPVYSVRGLKVTSTGVELTFTQPLDGASVGDLQNWSGKRWNYIRSQNYGSPEVSVADPSKKTRDSLTITGAKLAADGRTVQLTIEDFRPVMQQAIKWQIKARDGVEIQQEIQHTVHEVPGRADLR